MRIYLDTVHNSDIDIMGHDDEGFMAFLSEMKHDGYDPVIVNDEFASTIDEACERDCMWILYPKKGLEKTEKKAVKEALERGCGLLLSGEWGNINHNADNLNDILEYVGSEIRFNSDRITDYVNAIIQKIEAYGVVLEEKKIPQFIVIRDFSKHAVVKNITKIGYYAGCTLNAPDHKVIAYSSPSSFSDADANKIMNANEEFGSFNIAAFDIIDGYRIFAIGDTNIFSNRYINEYNNLLFCRNIVRWLTRGI